MAIVTISRQIGSLGDEIAKALADKLGYEYMEKSKISEVLTKLGFSVSDVEIYDEKKPSIWRTLSIQNKRFSHLIRAAVYELASNENVIIGDRGGQAILKNFPGTLHIRVVAPHTTRLSRLVDQMGCDENKAEQIIRRNDRDSSGYISTHFAANWDDQDLYDLVINTRSMSLDTAVAMITCALGASEFERSSQAAEKLRDLALTQKAKAALLGISGLKGVNLGVEKGVANFSGFASSPTAIMECESTVSKIKGITNVNNQIKLVKEEHVL